jgi:chromosomal replication initiation ATPase DnaA
MKSKILFEGMPIMPPARLTLVHSVLLAYNTSWIAVIGRSRRQRITKCRRALAWGLYCMGFKKYQIAKMIKKDHTSINHMIKKVNSW